MSVTTIISFLLGLFIGILIDKISIDKIKKIFTMKKGLVIDEDTINFILDDLTPRIIDFSKEYIDNNRSLIENNSANNICDKIANELLLGDYLPKEDIEIIQNNKRKNFLQDFIYTVIRSNYEEIIAEFNIEMPEPDWYKKYKIKTPEKMKKQSYNSNTNDISSTLMNFYNDGEEV